MESGDFPTFSAGTREAAAHAAAGRHPHIAELLATFEHRSKAGRHACMVSPLGGCHAPSELPRAASHMASRSTSPSTLQVVEPLGSSLEEAAALCGGGLGIGLPLEAVRGAARQALSALDHLHRWGAARAGASEQGRARAPQATCASWGRPASGARISPAPLTDRLTAHFTASDHV